MTISTKYENSVRRIKEQPLFTIPVVRSSSQNRSEIEVENAFKRRWHEGKSSESLTV